MMNVELFGLRWRIGWEELKSRNGQACLEMKKSLAHDKFAKAEAQIA